VKINTVVMKGQNEDEVLEIARLAVKWPVEVRFIEFMPVGDGSGWDRKYFVSLEEIRERLAPLGPLRPAKKEGAGPAKVYTFPGAKGRLGFIGAMSDPFCKGCNRLRLTPEGRLRPCLFSDWEIDLKRILRAPHRREEIAQAFQEAVMAKPASKTKHTPHRLMRSIGG
jgi:cyclic pyranopterin phosphate synthase